MPFERISNRHNQIKRKIAVSVGIISLVAVNDEFADGNATTAPIKTARKQIDYYETACSGER